jgi:hypothetical protein
LCTEGWRAADRAAGWRRQDVPIVADRLGGARMIVDVVIESKSGQVDSCVSPTIAVTVRQCYGSGWAESTRLGIGRLHEFRFPKEEADKLIIGEAYEMNITMTLWKREPANG